MRVAVVGGGAVGLTAAVHLAEKGAEVVLYERDELGIGSTARAAGICYDAFAEDVDARIAGQALRRFRELGVLTECPYVWYALDGDETNAEAIRDQVPRMQSHGRNVALVDAATLGERYPHLRTETIAVAAISREAGYVDPDTYVSALVDRVRKQEVDVRAQTPVSLDGPRTVVETSRPGTHDEHATFDAVLVAAGPATRSIVASADVPLALKAYRAQALVTEPLQTTLPMGYDATRHVYWRPRDGGLFVGNGAHEVDIDDRDGWNRDADDAFVESALERVRAATALENTGELAVDRTWAGLCTATPDRNPLLGEVADGLFVATGWHGHGFMRAPALGECIAKQVLGTAGSETIDQFDPQRFDGDETFNVVEGMTLDEN